MIIGIGTDIVEVSRIEKLLEKNNDFKNRCFTAAEQALADSRKDSATCYAGRWAAKEACAKALGCGIGADCALADVEILPNDSNAPQLFLHAAAWKRAALLGVKNHHVTISHEKNYAVATVILEN